MERSVVLPVAAFISLAAGCFIALPYYNVWEQEMSGKAGFAEAGQNRKIKIEEAKADPEAGKPNAQAEMERAEGAAEAVRIENGSITPAYIRYLRVRRQAGLDDRTVIYIPAGTNLPVLEADRNKQEYNKAGNYPPALFLAARYKEQLLHESGR